MSEYTDTVLNITQSLELTSDNLIPHGTIFTLDSDGFGDFETINDAVKYLNGKWSNGTVTIKLNAGTYTQQMEPDIILDGDKFNIPMLIITGENKSNTIINVIDNTVNDDRTCSIYGTNVMFSNLTFIMNRNPEHQLEHCFSVNSEHKSYKEASLVIKDCDFDGFSRVVWTDNNATTIICGNVHITNFNENCIIAQQGEVDINYATLNMNNNGCCCFVNASGIIKFNYTTFGYSNVNKTYNTDFNYWSSKGYGYIGGIIS